MTDKSLQHRIDEVCDQFEGSLRDGQRPSIEKQVDLIATEARRSLFAELVHLELQYRSKMGEACSPSDYLPQYGEFQAEIERAFDGLHQGPRKTAGTSPALDDPTITQGPANVAAEWETVPPASAEDTDEPTLVPSVRIASEASQVGDRVRYFGDYEILEEIARGGMGVVYKARQVSLNRVVALKMILAGQLAGDEEVQRFHAEAEAAANLDHPGIVPIYEIGQHQDQHYFSMGFVNGESLADRVKDRPLSPGDAAETMKKVAEAIAYAHENGVIHRDLKPANVLIDSDNQPKVTDFGLAKQVESDSDLTRTGAVMGTPSYMPPEQASGKTDEIAQPADVYSLGAILYCLITGRPPFQAANAIDTLMQVLEKEPVAPRLLNPEIPRDLETVCLKCLHKEPGRRYRSAEDFSGDLQRWLNGEPIQARRVSSLEKTWLWCKRKPAIAGSAIAVLVTLAVAAAILWQQRSANQTRIAVNAVDTLQNSSGAVIPFAIRDMRRSRDGLVLPELRRRFAADEGFRKVLAAYGLAAYGEVEVEFLVSRIGDLPADECDNIVRALDPAKELALPALTRRSLSAGDEERARLAIVALQLGDSTIAEDVHRINDSLDPTPQIVFIHEVFWNWHGDLIRMAEQLREVKHEPLQAGMCLAIHTVESADLGDSKRVWSELIAQWSHSRDPGTRSAALWALKQWGLELPQQSEEELSAARNWETTKHGLTLIRMPQGSLEVAADGEGQKVTAFEGNVWVSDAEITVGLFKRFANDEDYTGLKLMTPASQREKGDGWPSVGRHFSPTDDHPAQNMSWEEAVLFCNWLSLRTGLEPHYGVERLEKPLGGARLAVRLLENGTGYRLPTEAEWEYICRAGSGPDYHFCFGDDVRLLRRYAVFSEGPRQTTELPRTRMCNRWGFFDMHGNVSEWCYDLSSDLTRRVHRGGSWNSVPRECLSGNGGQMFPAARSPGTGFRVARGPQPANHD